MYKRQDEGVLEDGAVIDLTAFGTSYLSFAAHTNQTNVSNVILELDGPVSAIRRERVAPYTMFGDIPNLYFGRTLIPGVYTLTATPNFMDGEQCKGKAEQIQFTIVEDNTAVVIAPNPILNNEIIINFAEIAVLTEVSYQLTNHTGTKISEGQLTIEPSTKSLRFDVSNIMVQKGVYYLTIMANGKQQVLKVMK